MEPEVIVILVVIVLLVLPDWGGRLGRYERVAGPVDDDWQRAQREHDDHYTPKRKER